MATVVQLFNAQVGVKKESSIGTYAAPAAAQEFMFATSFKVEELIEDNVDESYQGDESKEHGFYPGFRSVKVTINGIVSQLPFGQHLMAFFGKDTVTGAGDPFTHTFNMLGAVPPSYTISVYDASITNTRAYVNCYQQSLTVKAGQKGLVTYESVYIGKYGDLTHVKPTAVYDTAAQYIPYEAALTLNNLSSTTLIDVTLKFEREVEAIFGFNNSQDLTAVSAGRVMVSGDATFVPAPGTTSSTEYDLYRANTQGGFVVLFTNTSSHSLQLSLAKAAFANGSVLDYGSPYVKVNAKLKGIKNTTDSGPASAVLKNSLTGAY